MRAEDRGKCSQAIREDKTHLLLPVWQVSDDELLRVVLLKSREDARLESIVIAYESTDVVAIGCSRKRANHISISTRLSIR